MSKAEYQKLEDPSPSLTPTVYNYGPRQYKDTIHSIVYFILFASVVGSGFYGYAHHNVNGFYAHDGTCTSGARSGPDDDPNSITQADALNIRVFFRHTHYFITGGVILSLFAGISLVYFFKEHPRFMTRFIIYTKISAGVAVAILFAIAGKPIGTLVWGGFTLLMAFVFYLWREQIELCARLLSVSGRGLQQNPSLIVFSLLLKLILLFVLIPVSILMYFSLMNGNPVKNSAALYETTPGQCYYDISDPDNSQTPCCLWQTDTWVLAYLPLASLFLLWTVMLAFEMRLFVIAGSITQWYFSEITSGAVVGNVRRSIGHAFGPHFGSLCYGSLVLAFAEMIRKINRDANNRARGMGGGAAVLMCLLATITSCLVAFIEYLTQFATIQMAISGESFCEAGHSIVNLLKRNFLNAYGVWWLPPMFLNCSSIIFSAANGTIVGLLAYAALLRHEERQLASNEALAVGIITFFGSSIVTGFFSNMLINVTDTCFVCYGRDLENHAITDPEIHEIFSAVPSTKDTGALVQNPDGSINYGNQAVPTNSTSHV